MDNDELVRLLSLRERKEAIQEELDWIDQRQAIIRSIYEREQSQLIRQREAALKSMQSIIREETRGIEK